MTVGLRWIYVMCWLKFQGIWKGNTDPKAQMNGNENENEWKAPFKFLKQFLKCF